MALLWSISASDEASWPPRTASATVRICVARNWSNRLYSRNSRFYFTRTDPKPFANPNLSLHHRARNSGGRKMSRITIFLVAAMGLAVVMPTRWTAAFLPATSADSATEFGCSAEATRTFR